MAREDAVRKIMNLLKLAESSNEHEAAQALDRARKLMIKYQVEETEVESKDETVVGTTVVPFLNKKQVWETTLCTAVANHFMCRITYVKELNVFTFYGSDLNREVAVQAFLGARNRLLELVAIALTNRPRYENPKAYRTSWLLGASTAIWRKLTEAAKEEKAESARGQARAQASYALVTTKQLERVDSYITMNVRTTTIHSDYSYASSSAFQKGTEAGKRLDLLKGVRG